MTTNYRSALRQLLESNVAPDSLLLAHESAVVTASRGDYATAAKAAKECHSFSVEHFGDIHPITFLLQMFHSELLAKGDRIEEAALQFAQVINALIFAIVSKLPEGDEPAAELMGLFFETALSDSTLRTVIIHFDKTEENVKSIGNVGASLLNSRPQQAHLLFKVAYEVRQQMKGKDHDDTLLAAHKFASSLFALGLYQEARLLFHDTFEKRNERFGFGHTLTLRSASSYALALYKTEAKQEALILQEKVYEMCRELNGDEHRQTRVALNNLLDMRRSA